MSKVTLSTGVVLISKPSHLNVPPWQMVSAFLGGETLRAATWWDAPLIPSTMVSKKPACWDESLTGPGRVEIATTGTWEGNSIGLQGSGSPNGNRAKIGVSTGTHTYAIFGDLNQQGTVDQPPCDSSQNGRGGLFYVLDNAQLYNGVRGLIKGDTAPDR